MQTSDENNFSNRGFWLKSNNMENVEGGRTKNMSTIFSTQASIADQTPEDTHANAMVDAGNAMLSRQKQMDELYSNLSQDLNEGVIGIDELKPEHEKRLNTLGDLPAIKGLPKLAEEKYKESVEQLKYKNEIKINELYEKGRIKKAEDSVLFRLEQLNEQALSKEANIENIKLMADDEYLNKTGKIAYGSEWEKKRQEIFYDLGTNYVQGQINKSIDSKDTQSLQELKNNLLDSEQYQGLKTLDRQNFIKIIDPAINMNVGKSYGQSFTKGIKGVVDKTGNLDASNIYNAMIWQQSQGRQFTEATTALVSDNGAVGISQITPDIAEKMVTSNGQKFDKEKFYSDPQYNAELGQAYFQHCLEEYGSPMLAATAYAVGEQKMNKLIQESGDPRKNEITEKDFINKIQDPKIKKHLTSVASYVANSDPNKLDTKAALMNIDNNPNLNEDQKRYAKAEITSNLEQIQKQYQQTYQANYESVWRDIFINKIPLSEVSPEQIANLKDKDQKQLMEYKKEPQLDLQVLSQVKGRIKAGEEVNILQEYGNQLPINKLDALLTMQKELTSNPQQQEKLTTTAAFIQERCKKLNINDAEATYELIDTVSDEIEQAQTAKKSKLTKQEMLDIADKHLEPVRYELALSEYKTLIREQQAPKANRDSMQIKDVPQDIRNKIIPLLKQHNLPVTDKNIMKCYKGIKNAG